MTKLKLAVGMTVWVVYGFISTIGEEHTITKLGRKWAYIGAINIRFDINTGLIDGGEYLSLGTVYASEQAYKDYLILKNKWAALQKAFIKSSYLGIPDDMTLEKIQQIKALLGMAE